MTRSQFDELKAKLGPVDGRRVVYFNGRSASTLAELEAIAAIEGLDLTATAPPSAPAEDAPKPPVVVPNKADADLLQEAKDAGLDPLPALNDKGALPAAARKALRERIEEAKKAATAPSSAPAEDAPKPPADDEQGAKDGDDKPSETDAE